MMAVAQNPIVTPSTTSDTTFNIFASRRIINGFIPVYLQGRIVSLTDRDTKETHKRCCVSLLDNLQYESSLTLSYLIEHKRIGLIHMEDHKIKSLTLTKEMIDMLNRSNVNGIVIEENKKHLPISDNLMMRTFVSDDQYIKLTAKIS